MNFKVLQNRFENKSNIIFEVIFTLFFRDLALILLPLFVITAINILFGELTFIKLLASSNFAFAVVVLQSIALSNFIELKAKHQQDVSYKLFEGTKMIMLSLIVSVMILALILLSENNVLTQVINDSVITSANVFLFFFAVLMIFLTLLFVKNDEFESQNFGRPKDTRKILKYLKESITGVNENINYSLFTLNNFELKEKINSKDFKYSSTYNKKEIAKIESLINDIEINLENVKNELKTRKKELEA